ncbi:hypothetical protein SLA2020_225050 [Shorea laevis]
MSARRRATVSNDWGKSGSVLSKGSRRSNSNEQKHSQESPDGCVMRKESSAVGYLGYAILLSAFFVMIVWVV